MRLPSVALVALIAYLGVPAARAEVSFRTEIAPVLVKRCLACHGELKFKGGYQLHTVAALLKPGESGEAPITPGKPEGSRLLNLLTEKDAAARMPKDADSLPDAEIELVKRWIAEGAKVEGNPGTSLVNLVEWRHPDPPEAYSRPFPVTAIAFRPDGQVLAIGGLHEITIWNAADGVLLRRIKGVAERTYALVYSKDGGKICAASGTPAQLGEVKLFNAGDGKLLKHFGSQADCALGAAFSPDESRLAVAGADSRLRVFNVGTGAEELSIKDHSDWVMGVAWSPDGSRLATASRDKTCKIFDGQSGTTVTTYQDHGASVYSIAYVTDGQHVVSCGADNRLHRWIAGDPGWENPEKQEKKKRHQVTSLSGFNGPVHQLTASGGQVFAVSADLSVRQFDLEKKAATKSFPGHDSWPLALCYHAETKRLATADLDGQVRVWKIDEKEPMPLVFNAAPGYTSKSESAQRPSEK